MSTNTKSRLARERTRKLTSRGQVDIQLGASVLGFTRWFTAWRRPREANERKAGVSDPATSPLYVKELLCTLPSGAYTRSRTIEHACPPPMHAEPTA